MDFTRASSDVVAMPRIASALALVAEGKTQHEAAAAVGVNPSTVSRWQRDAA